MVAKREGHFCCGWSEKPIFEEDLAEPIRFIMSRNGTT